jgi:hypothetical protein
LAGPACRRHTAALPCFSLFLPHPATDQLALLPPSPTCQSRSAASSTPRRSPVFMKQRRRPRLAVKGHCRPRSLPRATDRRAQGPLSLSRFLSSTQHRADHPISLSRSPPRARRFGEAASASRRSVSRPHPELELPSFSTAYAPASPAPGDPPSLLFPFERHRLHRFTVRPPICHHCPHLRSPSSSLFCTDTAGSCLHRHRPPKLPPRRRTPLPEAYSTASLSCRRSGELHPRLSCLAPSLWPP